MVPQREHLAASARSGTRTEQSRIIGSIALALMLAISFITGLPAANASTTAGGYDGPAALPRVFIQTAMANTPAPGITITVNSGENLQAALNNAKCGDTVQLQAGATFTGSFTFPAKACDNSHWIVVRTNAPDSVLPAEGTRLTPCYAGMSSLPGRPAFHCSSTKNVLARLEMTYSASGPIVFATGANHYRLIGLEITRTEKSGITYSLASVATHRTATGAANGTANNLILDRVWMHGTAQDDTKKGFLLDGVSYGSLIDSFVTDIHCVAITGACTDAAAVGGGANPVGPFKISGNFLESSGENILFGGTHSAITPADIEITYNHMFKPLTWMKGQPGYVGGANGNPFIVKNLFELKNAQRVLLDSNIMENVWGGYSQFGYALVLTPKNELCPICQVTDITIRYNYVSHMGGALQLANGLADNGAIPLGGGRYSIHDDVFDDIDGTTYHGTNSFAQVTTGPNVPDLHDITINHVTEFAQKTMLGVGDVLSTNEPMTNFVFTNNIVSAGAFPIWSAGTDGSLNCAFHDSPTVTLHACFSTYTFSNNAIMAIPGLAPESSWPMHNLFPSSAAAVEFVNYNGGNGGDYNLQPGSPYRNLGTDGKDLGADVPGLSAAIATVQ